MFGLDPEKKQKVLIIILVLVILITGLILYFRYFLKGTKIQINDNENMFFNQILNNDSPKPIIPKDLEIFDDPIFKDLEIPKHALDDIGPIGRDNPFAPF